MDSVWETTVAMAAHMTLRKPAKGAATKARRARKRASDAILAKNAALVRARDGHRCRVCGSRELVAVHHIRYRSRGGGHDTGNLVCLCRICHERVHAGTLVVAGDPDGAIFAAEPAVFDALEAILGRAHEKDAPRVRKSVDGDTERA